MGKYRLNRGSMRFSKKHASGRVVSQHKYSQGDVIEMKDSKAKRFVESGTFTPVEDVEETAAPEVALSDGPTDPDESSEPQEQAVSDVTDVTESLTEAPEEDDPGVQDYEAMSYVELQAEAKRRDLPYNGVKKVDLIASLSE